jgi:hypothetical protein
MNYAPIRNADHTTLPWEGDCVKKPWEYKVTAVIPVLDTPEMLELVVGLLQLQTEKPYVLIIDTGSTPENLEKITSLRSENVEVHSILLNGVKHPSDFPCFAQDMAHALCRTDYIFCTHADVFLTKRNVIEEMLAMCNEDEPVVGYQISPRPHADWVGMVGHTCMIYHVPSADNLGITWSQRRLCAYYGVEWCPDSARPNWPDTEVGFNVLWREAGITPKIIGTEENFIRNVTEHFDHCRSATGSKLYCPEYWKQCQEWLVDAMSQAKVRIKQWDTEKRA